jgi:hypothetical protein
MYGTHQIPLLIRKLVMNFVQWLAVLFAFLLTFKQSKAMPILSNVQDASNSSSRAKDDYIVSKCCIPEKVEAHCSTPICHNKEVFNSLFGRTYNSYY